MARARERSLMRGALPPSSRGMTRRAIALCAWALCLDTSVPALANDSMAGTPLGGLTLLRSDAISMDSEDIYIARDRVRVRYRFTNRSNKAVDALVAFPLPDIPADANPEVDRYWQSPAADLKFTTRVDGRSMPLQIVEQAFLGKRDIGAELTMLHVPLNRFSDDFAPAMARLSAPDRVRLAAEHMIRNDGGAGEPLWIGLWSLRTSVTRHQLFPAHRTISVEHDYVPMAGGSVGGLLEHRFRSQADTSDHFIAARRKYCLDDDWIRSFDRLLARRPTDASLPYSEIWLGYVLHTGANWKGPIGNFRLVVDKGKPDSLVSFCAHGVKRISATQFEIRRINFRPTTDLDILIIDWGDDGATSSPQRY
jgi:hypothetical protein